MRTGQVVPFPLPQIVRYTKSEENKKTKRKHIKGEEVVHTTETRRKTYIAFSSRSL